MLQIFIYVSTKNSLIFMSFMQHKSAVTYGTNISDITQEKDMHLVNYNLYGK